MHRSDEAPWWIRKQGELLEIAGQHLNAYVYDLETVRARAEAILALESVSRVLYAVKANFNGDILRVLADSGVDFDCVSPGEVEQVRSAVGEASDGRILFTPNFAPRDEYEWGIRAGVRVTLDNLYPLEAWPEMFRGQRLFIRVDPGQGRGHHAHVRTAGDGSKFGVALSEIERLAELVAAADATVIGIHAHSGSGILEVENWHTVAEALQKAAAYFPDVEVLDLGGGFGVPVKRGDAAFDLSKLDELLSQFRTQHDRYDLWLEPGRYLVSEAGVLLCHVTQLKRKGEEHYVGVSTGINALIRPALYDAWHEIVNLSRVHESPARPVSVVGPLCESGDRFAAGRSLPECREGDVILIANAGAYGQVMSSRYNLRDVPPEIAI